MVVDVFRTPSGRIACLLLVEQDGKRSARCGLRGGSSGLQVGLTGAATTSSWTWPPDDENLSVSAMPILDYDAEVYAHKEAFRTSGFARPWCSVSPSLGVTCRNLDHGFTLSRATRRRF